MRETEPNRNCICSIHLVLYKNLLSVHVHRIYWYIIVSADMRPPLAPPASSAAIPTAVTATHPDCTSDDRKPQQHHLNTATATTMVTWLGCRGRAERHTATKSRRTVTYRWRPWPYGALPRRSYRCPTSTSSSATGSRITGKTLKGQWFYMVVEHLYIGIISPITRIYLPIIRLLHRCICSKREPVLGKGHGPRTFLWHFGL